jgi:hypothetical protein
LSFAAFTWRCVWWRLKRQGKQSSERTAFTPCAAPCTGRCTGRSNPLPLSSKDSRSHLLKSERQRGPWALRTAEK